MTENEDLANVQTVEQPKTPDIAVEKPKKEETLANLKSVTVSDVLEQAMVAKVLTNEDVAKLAKMNPKPKKIEDVLETISDFAFEKETEMLRKIFAGVYGYETLETSTYPIPLILKNLFSIEKSEGVSKTFSVESASILNSNFIPLDIVNDTLVLLMRAPSIEDGFKDKIMPLMKLKGLKKVKIVLTTKPLFEYYKRELTVANVSDEL